MRTAYPIEGDNESYSNGRIKRGSALSAVRSPVLSGNPIHLEDEVCVCLEGGRGNKPVILECGILPRWTVRLG